MSFILQLKDDMPAFRMALRQWLARECPSAQDIAAMDAASGVDHVAYEEAQRSWMAKLDSVGLATPHWPAEYGGAGLSLQHQIVIADEMARANAPRLMMFLISLNHIPATLLAWGTEEQKARYLPGVAKGDVWCQGFSEPGSGSDLASLRTRAVRDGDNYVVNGQKLWSSQAMHAKRCILLARTDPQARKQAGISYFVLDMQTPGVQVRPIRQATGRSEFAEVFLDDVVIPVTDRIGEENKGWQVAQTTLASERGLIVFEETERMRYQMETFQRHAQRTSAAWLRDDQLRREFMRFLMRLQSLRRAVSDLLRHNDESLNAPTIAPSVIKVASSSLFQEYASFRTRIAGVAGHSLVESPGDPRDANGVPMRDYIESFGNTIAGGSNEIQLNIIAERGLGMPRG